MIQISEIVAGINWGARAAALQISYSNWWANTCKAPVC